MDKPQYQVHFCRCLCKGKYLEDENQRLHTTNTTHEPFAGVVACSPQMQSVCKAVEKVAPSDATVLLLGESGTGKDLIANAIHEQSTKANGPFVTINCAALPENLLESELFGYEKGAFSGAHKQKQGLFETAKNGTVFLDEIGDLPLSLQAKLLRVLQNNEIIHLGGTEPIQVDFRLITATHKNLEDMIQDQQFRSDLYYRINVFLLKFHRYVSVKKIFLSLSNSSCAIFRKRLYPHNQDYH